MRTPTLFFSLLCGAALTTLSLSTLPVAAQTRHHPPVDMDEFLMPDPVADKHDSNTEAEAGDPGRRDMQKYWRRIHGDRTGKMNAANIARARRQMSTMKPTTWNALHSGGTNGAGNWDYGFGAGNGGIGVGKGHGGGGGPRFNAAPIGGPGQQVGPGLPTPDPADGWKFIGPNQILSNGITVFTGPDPTAGRVNGAAFDPKNPNIYYLAAAGGGIWKTIDGGGSWMPLTDNVSGIPDGAFSSITVDPNNSNVLYAGTGDYDGQDALGFGLLKSVDGGANWVITSLPSGDHCIHKIVVDPNNSSHVLVTLGRDSTGTGAIFQSTDAGATWQDVADFPGTGPGAFPAGDVSNIVYNSDNTILYAAVDGAGIFKSIDNGATWAGPVGGLAATDRVDVAASPNQTNTLYYLSNGDEAIYKSIDGGDTWSDITTNFSDSYGLTDPTQPWGQGFYDFYITASSATFNVGGKDIEGGPGQITTDVLYVGLFSVTQCISDPTSTSGGFWSDLTFSYTGNATVHTDQHCLVVNPNNPNQVLVGNDGGIYLCNYSPDASTFDTHGLNNDLGITQIYASSVNPTNINQILVGAQDNAFPHADGDLNTWTLLQTGDGMAVQYTSTAPLVQYISVYNGFMFQSDFDWRFDPFNSSRFVVPVPDVVEFFTPLAMTANSRKLVSGGLKLDVFDHGATVYPPKAGAWTAGPTLPVFDANDICTAVGASPTNENVLYAGMASGFVVYSPTQGASIVRIDEQNNPGNPFSLPPLPVTSFVGSSKNVKRLYITMGQNTNNNIPHIFRCDNITVTHPKWWDLSGNGGPSPLPEVVVTSMVVLPHDDEKTIIVSTDVGVFITTNADAAPTQPVIWSPLTTIPGTNTSLPAAVVTRLNYNASTGTLDADTFGRGLWRCKIGSDTPFLIRTGMPGYRGPKGRLNARVDLFHAQLPDVAPNFEEPTAIGEPYKVDYKGKVYGTPYPHKYYLQPSEIRLGALSPSGFFNTAISARGFYDALITVPRFLRKRIRNVNTLFSPLNAGNLILGDCAGPVDPATGFFGPPDNVIDGNDLAAIANYLTKESFGLVSKYNSGPLDVNGDGVVDIKDYNAVLATLIANGGIVFGD